jgi:glutaryl-CoA dehydrogenase
MSATTLAVEMKPIKQPKELPAPNSDSYHFAEALPAEELALVKKVRTYVKTKVAPVITKYWAQDSFSFELIKLLEFFGNLFPFPRRPRFDIVQKNSSFAREE